MIIQSKKNPDNEQVITIEAWAKMKELGLQQNFRVIESGQKPTKMPLEFPKEMKVKTKK
jgi:hypothetical protein